MPELEKRYQEIVEIIRNTAATKETGSRSTSHT